MMNIFAILVFMSSVLLTKMVTLAHSLHKRLSFLSFLLNLSLLTLALRLILSLISSQSLSTIVKLLEGLNLKNTDAMKDYRAHLALFIVANLIIMSIFFTSEGGYSLPEAQINYFCMANIL
eukprot:c37853_g1_i1 orf=16-378(+)